MVFWIPSGESPLSTTCVHPCSRPRSFPARQLLAQLFSSFTDVQQDFVRIDDQTTASGPSDGTAAEQTSEPAAMPTPQEAATTIASTGLDPNPLQAATTEQDHTCTRCDMRPTFTSEEDLLRHQLRIHDMCPTCNQYLEPRQDTVQHFIMEHNLCKQCFLIFGTGVNLREVRECSFSAL